MDNSEKKTTDNKPKGKLYGSANVFSFKYTVTIYTFIYQDSISVFLVILFEFISVTSDFTCDLIPVSDYAVAAGVGDKTDEPENPHAKMFVDDKAGDKSKIKAEPKRF